MRVVARKIPGGWLIPAEGELEQLQDDRITVELTLLPVETSYKELAAEAAVERYLEKQQRELPPRLGDAELDNVSRRYGLKAETVEDLLEL